MARRQLAGSASFDVALFLARCAGSAKNTGQPMSGRASTDRGGGGPPPSKLGCILAVEGVAPATPGSRTMTWLKAQHQRAQATVGRFANSTSNVISAHRRLRVRLIVIRPLERSRRSRFPSQQLGPRCRMHVGGVAAGEVGYFHRAAVDGGEDFAAEDRRR
jgi:hypothetical protein